MLVIWSSAGNTPVRKVFGPVVSQNQVEHRVDPSGGFPKVSQGDIVLACGTKALNILQGLGLVPKGRTVTSMREKVIQYNGAKILITFDPKLPERDYARLPEMQWDVQLACRLLITGNTRPVIGGYRYVDSLHEIIERVDELYDKPGNPVEIGADLETLGLDEYAAGAYIIACSFTIEEGKSDVLYFEPDEAPLEPPPWEEDYLLPYWEGLWVQINWLLNSPKVSIRGANFKFDCRWMAHKWNIFCTNQKFDTTLVGSLLDENRSNSLKLHAKIMTPMGGYEDDMGKYDFAHLDEVPKPEMLNYVGGDTDVTLRVSRVLKKELLKDKALTNFYVKLLQPSVKVFEKMERNGVCVDIKYYFELKKELMVEVARLEGSMVDMLPYKMQIKHKDSIADSLEDGKNPLKPSILKEFLFTPYGLNLKPQMFTEKNKDASTAIDHLMMFAGDPVAANFINLFKEYGSATKTLSTFVVGFLKHLRSDGKFHPSYMLFRGAYGGDEVDSGANTGRTSLKDPALQTVPKHTSWTKKLRRAFIPPPGMTILQLDYSQGELKITAVVANEPTMLKAYLEGKDLHAITAAKLNGYSMDDFMLLPDDVRDNLRSGGKAGNFGLIYGMQYKGYKEYAFSSYGVVMTEDEAYQSREAFFELYSALPKWHEDYKRMAHKNEFVRSPLGRVRHLPLINTKDPEIRSQAERQAINAPIQSCLSDMMQLAMVYIEREYGQSQIQMFLMTHDSLACYCPEGEEVIWAQRLKYIMENLPLKRDFGWDSPLQFTVDAEVSMPGADGVHSLATLKKLKGL